MATGCREGVARLAGAASPRRTARRQRRLDLGHVRGLVHAVRERQRSGAGAVVQRHHAQLVPMLQHLQLLQVLRLRQRRGRQRREAREKGGVVALSAQWEEARRRVMAHAHTH